MYFGGGFDTVYTPPLGKLARLKFASLASDDFPTQVAQLVLQHGFGGPVTAIATIDATVPQQWTTVYGEWDLNYGDAIAVSKGSVTAVGVSVAGFLY